MLNTDRLIKVHVTREQRDLLERIVLRRLRDVRDHTWGNWRPTETELEMLHALKTELEQSGT